MVHVMGIYAGGTVYQQCTSRKQDVLTDLFGRLFRYFRLFWRLRLARLLQILQSINLIMQILTPCRRFGFFDTAIDAPFSSADDA